MSINLRGLHRWSKRLASLLALFVLFLPQRAAAKYSGGIGTPGDPYRIATPQDLNDIASNAADLGSHFALVNDINIADFTGAQFNIIGDLNTPFTGVFDGNQHTISNFTWTWGDRHLVGLFGFVGAGAQIKNLKMENVSINAGNGFYIGGLVGLNYQGAITNCHLTGSVAGNGTKIGGLAGMNYSSSAAISDCHFVGSVSGDYEAGGIVGRNYGQVTRCYSEGAIGGKIYVGGLVGGNYQSGSVSNCYSMATVSAHYDVGGLVGRNSLEGTIKDCFARGDVTGNDEVGGLVGDNESGKIINSYSTGAVRGLDEVGGLVGANEYCELYCDQWGQCDWLCDSGSAVNSFWDIETSGQSQSSAGVSKTTIEMKTESTFTGSGWDFVGETANGTQDIWTICQTTNYPRFVWSIASADFICPDGVDFLDFAVFASAWISKPGDANWLPICDISQPKDSFIDMLDLAVFCENWLEGK